MKKVSECYTCELTLQRDNGLAPLWDNIYRTTYWDVVHSFNTGLPGWLILVVRRHIEAIDQLSEEEASELGVLLRKVSIALKEVTGCRKTYVLQFAEHPRHPHIHVHVVPRMADQPENRRGPKIMEYTQVPENERVSEEAMNGIGEQVRKALIVLEGRG